MAYDYLGLVNDLNHRVNETPLTSSNFSTATGFYSTAKDAINSAIRDINQEQTNWPFNHNTQDDTLVAGTMRYSLPADTKTVNWSSFRIKRDGTIGNETKNLIQLDYEEYLARYLDDEYNTTDTGIRTMPRYVVRTPSTEYIVHPSPDETYPLTFEYYGLQTDLSAYGDTTAVPAQFRHVIVDGAMYYVSLFRNDDTEAQLYSKKFKDGIENMRTIFINRYEYVRDTRVQKGRLILNERVS